MERDKNNAGIICSRPKKRKYFNKIFGTGVKLPGAHSANNIFATKNAWVEFDIRFPVRDGIYVMPLRIAKRIYMNKIPDFRPIILNMPLLENRLSKTGKPITLINLHLVTISAKSY